MARPLLVFKPEYTSADNSALAQYGIVLEVSALVYSYNTQAPSTSPTTPTLAPTTSPTASPTLAPTTSPTASPTLAPSASPTLAPSASPTLAAERVTDNVAKLVAECFPDRSDSATYCDTNAFAVVVQRRARAAPCCAGACRCPLRLTDYSFLISFLFLSLCSSQNVMSQQSHTTLSSQWSPHETHSTYTLARGRSKAAHFTLENDYASSLVGLFFELRRTLGTRHERDPSDLDDACDLRLSFEKTALQWRSFVLGHKEGLNDG